MPAPDPAEPDDELDAVPAAVVPAPKQRGAAYDWPTIRRRYVEGVPPEKGQELTTWPSLMSVADHFGVPQETVKTKSAQEGWPTLRSKWQAQVEVRRQQARLAHLAKQGVELDGKALDVAKLGLQLAMFELQRTARAAQDARAGGDASAGRIPAVELQRLAAAADVFHKIGLRSIGDTETTRVELTGAGGSPIEISQELRRDDPTRIAGVLGVSQQAGLGELFGGVSVESQVKMRELLAERAAEVDET